MSRRGFSMIEVMVVLSITLIIVAIAIPNILEMQKKAKRAELPVNIAGIRTAETAYNLSFDEHLELPLMPRADDALDKNAVPWDTAEPSWRKIGFVPDGLVRGNYQVGLSQVDHPDDLFLITARCDVDDDNALAEYTASDDRAAVITEIRALLY